MPSAPSQAGNVRAAKRSATVALIDIDKKNTTIIGDCFHQFGIEVIALGRDDWTRLLREKFEACVLRLDDNAAEILQSVRGSSSNRRIVIYGLAPELKSALRFSKFGVNAVLDDPVERQMVLRVVRNTHLLVIHELRRYVRVPVVTEVIVEYEERTFSATSVEISAGGMSLWAERMLKLETPVQVTFALPNVPRITVKSKVRWLHEGAGLFGVRFDADDDWRYRVKQWIDDYLEIS